MRWVIRWLVLAGSVLGAAWATQALGLGFEASAGSVGEFITLLFGAAILAFLNATLGALLKLVTLPLNCLTLGLFSLLVNGFILILAAEFELGFRFTTSGLPKFGAALVAAALIAMLNGLLTGILLPEHEKKERRRD